SLSYASGAGQYSSDAVAGDVILRNEASGKMLLQNGAGPSALAIRGNQIGIGTTTPGFPLTFANVLGDKISLWGQSGNHYGFGIQGGTLQIFTDGSSGDVAFGYGSSGAMTETMRLKGNGNLGIGLNNPGSRLHVSGTDFVTARFDSSSTIGTWMAL